MSRFEREVDPDHLLAEDERSRRAEIAKRRYFARLTLARVTAASKKNATGTGKVPVALGAGRADDAQPVAL